MGCTYFFGPGIIIVKTFKNDSVISDNQITKENYFKIYLICKTINFCKIKQLLYNVINVYLI